MISRGVCQQAARDIGASCERVGSSDRCGEQRPEPVAQRGQLASGAGRLARCVQALDAVGKYLGRLRVTTGYRHHPERHIVIGALHEQTIIDRLQSAGPRHCLPK